MGFSAMNPIHLYIEALSYLESFNSSVGSKNNCFDLTYSNDNIVRFIWNNIIGKLLKEVQSNGLVILFAQSRGVTRLPGSRWRNFVSRRLIFLLTYERRNNVFIANVHRSIELESTLKLTEEWDINKFKQIMIYILFVRTRSVFVVILVPFNACNIFNKLFCMRV